MATAGPVVERVSRTRTIPPAELEKEKLTQQPPELWSFMESAKAEAWDGMTLYILREDPKPSLYGGTNTLEKCPGYIVMPDGSKQPLNSREDVELAIKHKYGGKAFRLILKKTNGERICEGKCMNEAQPRYPDATAPAPYNPPQNSAQMSDTNSIAAKAIDTVANKESEAIGIAMTALRSTADMLSRLAAPPAAPVNPAPTASLENDLDRAFKAAMIQRLMADPVETFVKMKAALGDSNGGGNTAMNSIVERFLSVAADKVFNPAAAVTGRTTMLDIGRELVPVLGNVMHEYRLSREADARIAELTRTQQPPQQTAPALPVAAVPVPAVPASAQPAPNPPRPQPAPQQKEAPSFSWVAERVARIVKNVEFPVDEAVERVLAFLYDTDEKLVPLLIDPPKLHPMLKPGKEGLVQLFQSEPALASCMVNTPRVLEFIDKFIAAAKEAEENEAKLRDAAPANAAAPTPAPAG